MNKVIFNIDGHKKLAKSIADELNMEVGQVKTTYFSDGELMVKSLSDVKDKDVYILQSTDKPAVEHLFKIILLVDSCKNAHAKNVHLIVPYFGFARQERISWKNEPNSCKVVANILSHSGASTISCIDLHHPIIYSFFDNIRLTDIRPYKLFKNYYAQYFKKRNISLNNVCVVAPDHGANRRAHELSESLGLTNDVVILTKHRPRANQSEVLAIDGDVKDKNCIIIDDIIDTGKTISNAAKMLLEKGAKSVCVGACHGVFSAKAYKYLHQKYIDDVVILNTINKRYPKWIHILDIAPLLVENILANNI